MTDLAISVVVPVYNAAPYVRQAVASALAEAAVAEVLLVEDGSPDGSLAECERLAAEDARVRLLRHPGGANRGAGASRNLGIAHAGSPLVAFLDADDYYLPGRFDVALQKFADPAVDGVCEAIGAAFESGAERERYLAARADSLNAQGLTTIVGGIAPEALLAALIAGRSGTCSLVGLTARRELLRRAGGLADLPLFEDTEYLLRLAYHGRLVSGLVDRPVAMRRVHAANRITHATRASSGPHLQRLWRGMLHWGLTQNLPVALIRLLVWRTYWETRSGRGRRIRWLARELTTAPGLTLRWVARLARAGVWNPLPRLPEQQP